MPGLKITRLATRLWYIDKHLLLLDVQWEAAVAGVF